MYVTHIKSGKRLNILVEPVKPSDYSSITKMKFFFNWKLEKDYDVYKLSLGSEILALASIEKFSEEYRLHIRLMSVNVHQKGRSKDYYRIIGNLLTYISKLAIGEYAELACVSLKPKGAVAQHYIDTYGMNITGATLSLELPEIFKLIEIYDHDEK